MAHVDKKQRIENKESKCKSWPVVNTDDKQPLRKDLERKQVLWEALPFSSDIIGVVLGFCDPLSSSCVPVLWELGMSTRAIAYHLARPLIHQGLRFIGSRGEGEDRIWGLRFFPTDGSSTIIEKEYNTLVTWRIEQQNKWGPAYDYDNEIWERRRRYFHALGHNLHYEF